MATSNTTGYSDQDLLRMQQDAIRRMREMQRKSNHSGGNASHTQPGSAGGTTYNANENRTGNSGNNSNGNSTQNNQNRGRQNKSASSGGNPFGGLGNLFGGISGGLGNLFGGSGGLGNLFSGSSGGLLGSLFGGKDKTEQDGEKKGGLSGLLSNLNLDSETIIIGLLILLLARDSDGENNKLLLALVYLIL